MAKNKYGWEPLAEAIGVRRVAKVTGLDRTGVEVACAVRPGGHVLQVCNGKGDSFEQAGFGAVLEAAELFCAERVDPTLFVFGSRAELCRRSSKEAVWDAADLGSAGELVAPQLWSQDVRVAWRSAMNLLEGGEVMVPAQALHCPPSDAPLLGPIAVAWTSNGMGAYEQVEPALQHALLEAVERHELALALPEAWTEQAIAARMLTRDSVKAVAPSIAERARQIEEAGFLVFLFDLSGKLGLPVAGALLIDREGGPVPLVAGYGCALTREGALRAALLEAAQSRLTDIHGAREDVAPPSPTDVQQLRSQLSSVRPRRHAERMPQPDIAQGQELGTILALLQRSGFRRAAAVDLAPPSLPARVIKVVIPGLRVSGLL